VKPLREDLPLLEGYECLDGAVLVIYSPGTEEQAAEMQYLLEAGAGALSEVLDVEPPELEACLLADEDWDEAPRESARAYSLGLPYFTRSVHPPALKSMKRAPGGCLPAFRATATSVSYRSCLETTANVASRTAEKSAIDPATLGESISTRGVAASAASRCCSGVAPGAPTTPEVSTPS
jgi:hypothetical protein